MVELIVILLLFAALVGLFYCWAQWRMQLRLFEIAGWRRMALSFGLFAVTLQALLFVSMWTPLSRLHDLLRNSMTAELVLLALAIPCGFAWKGSARWWLLTASIGFSVGCFFSMLAELAY